MEGLDDWVLAFVIGLTCNRPIIGVTSHLCLLMIVLLMELEVQPVLDGASAVGVVKDDLVGGVFMIGHTRLVPCPRRYRPVFITLILIEHRGHLKLADRQHQFFHFQAAMKVHGVKIGDLPILAIAHAVEVVGFPLTDTGVDECCVIGRIHREVKSDDAIAPM